MPTDTEFAITIRLVCRDLPGIRFVEPKDETDVREPVLLGIQRDDEAIELTPADRRQVTFKPTLRVRWHNDGAPNFLGPFVHGKPRDRFVYLVWACPRDDGTLDRFRRAKVMLRPIGRDAVLRARDEGFTPTATLRLTDDLGGPYCATVRPDHVTWDA